MKQLFAILTMLLVGVMPLALAVEASISTTSDTSAQAGEETSAESSSSAEITIAAKDKPKERREQRQAEREERQEKREEIKALVKDVVSLKKETRANLKEHRQALKEKLVDLKSCKGQKTEECDSKRKEAKSAVIENLKESADEVIALLESVKAQVAGSSVENKETVTADITAQIKVIADAKVQVEALSDTSSKEEIKTASEALRKAIREAKHSLKLGKNKIFAHKLGGVLERSKSLEDRLERTLAKLKEKGTDTSTIDLAGFEAKLEASRKAHAEAVVLFEKARAADSGEKDELMKQATDKLRESHKILKEAHALLKDIVVKLKALKGGTETLASTKASVNVNAEASQG